jgi:hypothetical protein
MTEFFKSELKDKFLEYACSRDDYFETQLLYDEFLRPNYDRKFAEKLIKEILEYDNQLLDTISGNGVKVFMLSSTAYTDEFLESGGFKNLFIQEEEKWDTFLQHLGGGRSSKKKPMKKSTKSSLKRERQWIILLLSMLGFSFLVSSTAVVWTLFSEPKVSEKELEERLKRMEIRHMEEVQSLQRELNAIRQYHEADSSQ